MSFTHRAPLGLAKRAKRHFFHLFLLVLFLLPVFAQAQVSPPGPSICLNGPLPPFQSGSTPSNPGRWSNPDRPGLSWDFTFNPDPNNPSNRTLTAFWYGFASPQPPPSSPILPLSPTVPLGEPIWYISNSVQYDTNSWQAPLYRAEQVPNGAGGYTARVADDAVGHVAVSFVPGQPEHMAVSWQLRTMAAPIVECIQRLGSDANPSRSVVEQVGPAYSGLWFAPLSSGWGYQALVDLRAGTGGAVEFRESNIVSVYDTDGQPVWFAADGLPNSAWGSTPPPLAVTELPLKYVRATYDVTAATVPCVSGCTALVAATGAGVTKFWRSYLNPGQGKVGVNVNAQFGSRAVNFARPASVSAANLLVSEKLTQASNIVASPTNCVPSVPNATTCPVAVSWAVLTTGFFGSVTALPYVRDLDTGAVTPVTPANSSGAIVVNLAVGKRVQFLLRTSSNQIIAQSSEIRSLSPKLDDPAYDGLQPYSPAVQADYAGTGGGSGGTSGGQASYSIPIQMAPGRHGMQPSVSLNYSSRAGNGVAGMGWSVSAASSLHRCPKTWDQDGVSSVVKFDGDDRLCLDGQRLIKVNGANYGTIDSEYRTEQDGQAKVLQLGGDLISAATYFVVYRADGMRDYYGAVAGASDTATLDVSAQQLLTGNDRPLAWMLRESLDRSNNTVRYSYSTNADNYGSGELLLKKIDYTGVIGTPGNRTVEFSYTPRPDISSSGLGGSLSRQTQVLTNIETKTPDTSGATVLVRSYTLNYGAVPNVIGVSKATGRAQLTQITECAADKCFMPTLLSWLDTPTSAPNVIEGTINWRTGMPAANPGSGQSYSAQKPDDIRPLGDLDGDGVVEIMRSVRTSTTTSRHFIVAFNADRSARSCFDLDLMLSESQGLLADTDALTAADFNNDGRADILVANRIFFADKVLPATSQCGAPPAGAFKEFSLASIGNACILTDGLTQFPFGAVRTLMPTDLNGDGLTDLALYTTGTVAGNSCPAGNGYGLYYWINTTPPAPVAGQMNTALSFGASNKLPLQAFTNTGTTAGYEQIVSLSDLNGDAIPELLTSYPAGSGAKYDEYSYRRYNSATLSTTAFTFGSGAEIAQGAALNLLDVNGDGLSDLLYATTNEAACTSAWQLQENRGGTFVSVPLLASPSAELSEGIRVDRLGAEGACNRSTRNYWATQAQLMAPADLNADGRNELMIPSSFAEQLCTAGVYYQEIGKPSLTPTTACAPVPDVSVAEGQGDNTSLADRATRTFFAGANGTQPIGPVLSRALLDSSAYRFSALNFTVLANGSYALSKVPLPTTFTRQVSGGPSTAPYVPASLDFFGDGLTDLVSERGCRAPYIFSISQNPCFNPSGAPPSTIQVRMFFNNGAGARTNRAPLTPELLSSVSDAYGTSIEWVYDALSSAGNRISGLPLYRLPARDGVAPDAPYIDAKHFYFTSSMQVVAEMLTRNGLGSITSPGMNETRYGYEEAMYNQQGRGFQGFRKIISEDHTLDNTDNLPPLSGKFGLRSTTIFHQKFPLTGMVECEGTTKLGIALGSCAEVVSPSMTLISGSKNDYLCRVAGAATTATACTDWAERTAATYGFAYPNQTEGFQFDLTNHALMRTTTKNIDIIDQYGNVSAESSSNTSTFAGGATETRGMSVARDYAPDANVWWVNKLLKQTSTAAALSGSRALTGVLDPLGLLNPTRKSTMVYGYHANRQVECEAMIPGAYTPDVTASSCDSAAFAPSSTEVAALDGSVERRSKSSFDTFGNVTGVITFARGEALSRTLSSNYIDSLDIPASRGYFPNSVTDALGAITTSTFDNRFGKPNSIKDPNQLTSSTTFDGMGREIGMVFPGALIEGLTDDLLANQLAPPKRIAYETCTPVLCPNGAVLRVVSDQQGTPRQIAFMDALGRTVRSAKASFNQTDANGGVLRWDTVDTRFSTRGLSYETTEPRQILNKFLATTGLISGGILTTLKYDQLGRVLNKVSTRVARNSADGYGSALRYRTEYSHTGFKTAIRVCGLGLSEIACPNGPTFNSYGFILDMTREFDESGAVLNTKDAKNGVTTFFYDAAHSPVKLVDAGGADAAETLAYYNNVGHRTSVNDPNRGIWTYQYNGFGELKKQTDARALSLTQIFDKLGRMISRSWMQPDRVSGAHDTVPNLSDTFTYNNAPLGGQYGTLMSTERLGIGSAAAEGSVKEQYFYDALNRPMSKSYIGTNVAGQSWNLTETTRYDPNFGRPVRKNFPAVSGAEEQKIYMGYTLGGDPMQTGFDLRYLASDPRSANATRYLRRDEGANARGQVISSRFGSGDASQAFQWLVSEYDASTGWLLSRCSGLTICSGVAQSGTNIDGAATMKLGYEYDYFGNVSKSVNIGKRPGNIPVDVRQETFGYDPLHRMTAASRSGPGVNMLNAPQVTYDYSPVGNLRFKTDFGSDYLYNDPAHKHAVKQVTLAGSAGTMYYDYDANGNVSARGKAALRSDFFGYDIDNRPQYTKTAVGSKGAFNRIDFYLSATGAKALQVAQTALGLRKVIYAGAYEAEYTNGMLKASRTYLAEGVLHNGAGDQQGLSFMHQDRLGSALVITDKGGLILGSDGTQAEFRTFDAFGKARDNQGLDNLDGRLFANNPNGKRNRKGFTGHEHLDEAGLIHMNGRAYDYNLGRFYGVDPVIQFPTNSQSLNGYSYLMNNPLAGTDPTGYCQAETGTKICTAATELTSKIGRTLAAGGTVVLSGLNAKETAQVQAFAAKNGFSTSLGTSQRGLTDGAKGGASKLYSGNNRSGSGQPADVTDAIQTNPNLLKHGFPKLIVGADGNRTIDFGEIPVSPASETYIPDDARGFFERQLNWVFSKPTEGDALEFIGKANSQWNMTVYSDPLIKSERNPMGITYSVIAEFRLATPSDSWKLSFSRISFVSPSGDISNNGIGKSHWIGIVYDSGKMRDKLIGHETGHLFGQGHQWNETNRRSSYSDERELKWDELNRLWKAYFMEKNQ